MTLTPISLKLRETPNEVSLRELGFRPTLVNTPGGFYPGATNGEENQVLNLTYKKRYQIQDIPKWPPPFLLYISQILLDPYFIIILIMEHLSL